MKGILICFAWAAISCNNPETMTEQNEIALQPLSPYSYEFADPRDSSGHAKNRNDYYFTNSAPDDDSSLVAGLQKELDGKMATGKDFNLHSVYIYRESSQLNASFKGTGDDLKGVHDNDLIAYFRSKNGVTDIFYLIKNGNIVYDALEHKALENPVEFD